MTYRDDLEAAHAQIDALKAELAALRSEHELLLARVRPPTAPPIVPVPSAGKWPTVFEHNRRFPSAEIGKAANVDCPSCAVAGKRVQMVRDANVVAAHSDGQKTLAVVDVICPVCLFAAMMRGW